MLFNTPISTLLERGTLNLYEKFEIRIPVKADQSSATHPPKSLLGEGMMAHGSKWHTVDAALLTTSPFYHEKIIHEHNPFYTQTIYRDKK